MPSIMISYLMHYCQKQIEQSQDTYELFAIAFRNPQRNPCLALQYLDTCLNSFYWDSPFQETLPADRPRQRPNLPIWARMTTEALGFRSALLNNDKMKEEGDLLIGRIFCHWDNLLRALIDTISFPDYDDDKKVQDLMNICNAGGKAFGERIQDEYNDLGKCAKHAVSPLIPFNY